MRRRAEVLAEHRAAIDREFAAMLWGDPPADGRQLVGLREYVPKIELTQRQRAVLDTIKHADGPVRIYFPKGRYR